MKKKMLIEFLALIGIFGHLKGTSSKCHKFWEQNQIRINQYS